MKVYPLISKVKLFLLIEIHWGTEKAKKSKAQGAKYLGLSPLIPSKWEKNILVLVS